MKKRYAILLNYHGAPFCGWQVQPKRPSTKPSIQALIQKSLSEITQHQCSVVASGRTDSGVHALGQVAHFDLVSKRDWQPEILRRGLNSKLPLSIRVLACQEVDSSFHAISSAIKKQYSYYFQVGPSPVVSLVPVSRWMHSQLNVEAMNQAIQSILGEHDFKAFQASGGGAKTTVRRIFEATVSHAPAFYVGGRLHQDLISMIRVRVVGSGFLKQMVRGLVGTLTEIGQEKQPVERIEEILATRDRKKVGPTAPARGLWLESVTYPDSLLEWKQGLS